MFLSEAFLHQKELEYEFHNFQKFLVLQISFSGFSVVNFIDYTGHSQSFTRTNHSFLSQAEIW